MVHIMHIYVEESDGGKFLYRFALEKEKSNRPEEVLSSVTAKEAMIPY